MDHANPSQFEQQPPAAGAASSRLNPEAIAPFAESIVWIGRRLATALPLTPLLHRRAARSLERMFVLANDNGVVVQAVRKLFGLLGLGKCVCQNTIAGMQLPAIAVIPRKGYGFVYGTLGTREWLCEFPGGRERIADWPRGTLFLATATTPVEVVDGTAQALLRKIINTDRNWVGLTALASTVVSLLVLGTSLFSMQVYDRVISQGGISTLIVLTIGVVLATCIELVLKIARSEITDQAVKSIDVEASVAVYDRLLGIRIDQLPGSLGTLAAQVRGFETARAYALALRNFLVSDLPFALIFLALIALIGGWLAVIPLISAGAAVAIGLGVRRSIDNHSRTEQNVSNRRQGWLVETIQNLELIKATGGAWFFQGRWHAYSRRSADSASDVKHVSEMLNYVSGFLHQISYIALVATGAYIAVTTKSLTTGSIIACSIASGRVLGPIAAIPGLLLQSANAKAAMISLEHLFRLETDNHGVEKPITVTSMQGRVEVSNLEFCWPGQSAGLAVKTLTLEPGSRVGIIGAVGAGKSTLLKCLSGLVMPTRGQVRVDGVDVHHIAPECRAEFLGYLPQTSRLFGGTLRENLTLGLPYVDDERIRAAAQMTGLHAVIHTSPSGLDLRIPEGGEGLSGGQRQLVAFTRLLLAGPKVWLLDEPTASMDDVTEQQCIDALNNHVAADHSLVIVTHKTKLLDLVDRLIVLTPQGIAFDGPKATFLAQVQAAQNSAARSPAQPAVRVAYPKAG